MFTVAPIIGLSAFKYDKSILKRMDDIENITQNFKAKKSLRFVR